VDVNETNSSGSQIRLSATSRGIIDRFFCFTCNEYVWDCDHRIDWTENLVKTQVEW
jgi:hypothetical protein